MRRRIEYWAATLLWFGIPTLLVAFGIAGLLLWGPLASAEFMAGYLMALWLVARDHAKAKERRR